MRLVPLATMPEEVALFVQMQVVRLRMKWLVRNVF